MRLFLALLLCAFLLPLSATSLVHAQDTEQNVSDDEVSATARRRLTFSPPAGPLGTRVELAGAGFRPHERLRLLVGRTASDLRRQRNVQADRRGRVQTSVGLPGWARPGRSVFFALQSSDGRRRAAAGPFRVTERRPQLLTLRGTLITGGAECALFRSDDGRRYSLTGELGSFRPGDRVVVRGRVAEVSTCMQGRTLAVQRISKTE
jgi:hypothetical protein